MLAPYETQNPKSDVRHFALQRAVIPARFNARANRAGPYDRAPDRRLTKRRGNDKFDIWIWDV
ncbi:MAG: hypothetical protein HY584_03595 [Candidatus Omnitrophica bacterium]|nr:hypothetical protein [Candidatus Omnitrophota bacterium]